MSQDTATTGCVQLIHQFFMSVDRGDTEAVADLVCSDITYVTPRMELSSAKAVIDTIHTRPVGQITRHVITNFALLQHLSDVQFEGSGYLMMFRSLAKPETNVGHLSPMEAIADLHATFLRDASGWHISRIVLKPVLVA